MSIWHGQRPERPERLERLERPGRHRPIPRQRSSAVARVTAVQRRLDVFPHGPLVMVVGLLGIVVTLALAAPAVATTIGLVVSATVIAVGWEATNAPETRGPHDHHGGPSA